MWPPVITINAQYVKAKDKTETAALPGRDYYAFSVIDNGFGFEQDGFIRAESEPGKGTAFYFFIPIGEITRYKRG